MNANNWSNRIRAIHSPTSRLFRNTSFGFIFYMLWVLDNKYLHFSLRESSYSLNQQVVLKQQKICYSMQINLLFSIYLKSAVYNFGGCHDAEIVYYAFSTPQTLQEYSIIRLISSTGVALPREQLHNIRYLASCDAALNALCFLIKAFLQLG